MRDQSAGYDLIRGLDANSLEHLMKGLVPVVCLSEKKFLFGTKPANIILLSDKIMCQVGGGHIAMENHWRTIAISECIKINKLIANSKKIS